MVALTCGTLAPVTRSISANVEAQNFLIPDNFNGYNCVFSVTYPITASNSPVVSVIQLATLDIIAPVSINYGRPVALKVDTNGPQTQYTADFACPTGNYQITGMSTGIVYNLVPAGIFGQVVITVTAENVAPATASLSIVKANANIAPGFIPSRIPNYPSVYMNTTDGTDLEAIGTD